MANSATLRPPCKTFSGDAAIEAAQSAAATKVVVERTLALTESALAKKKAARDRGDRVLREAQATIAVLRSRATYQPSAPAGGGYPDEIGDIWADRFTHFPPSTDLRYAVTDGRVGDWL